VCGLVGGYDEEGGCMEAIGNNHLMLS
jgi:hypothetical protein